MPLTNEIEEMCRKLRPILGNVADELWKSYLVENEQGRKKLAIDIQVLFESTLKNQNLSEHSPPLLPPPSAKNSAGEFLVGNVIYNNSPMHSLFLRKEDFIKQMGIFAITGEGKTNLATLLAVQLLQQHIPFLVIDWKRSWRNLFSLEEQFPELKNVRLFTVGRSTFPFFWNPLRAPPGADQNSWISTVAECLESSHLSGPGVAYFFTLIYQRLFRGLKGDFFPNFHDGLREIQPMKAFERELRWKQTALRIFQSFTTGNSAKAFNARQPLQLESLLDKPVILELDIEMPKPLRVFSLN